MDGIAITGIGCRFPGHCNDADSFWSLLLSGKSAIGEIPPDRWSLRGFYDPAEDNPHRSNSKWGGFLSDISAFDPDFFGISRREAEAMDPQQRLLLHVACEAARDASLTLAELSEAKTGVFIGASNVDYDLLQRYEFGIGDIQAGTGTALSIVANRLSNALNLHGPSMAIDTACSSSLVALDAACKALHDKSTDICLSGGVNILLDPRMFITFSRAHMLSRVGRVAAFDAGADGFVRAEGVGLVVLKRLEDAQSAGDRIYAVIASTAVNQDGGTNSITAPNPEAQKSLIREAIAKAGVNPSDVVYVEAHGTGTPVGDPIEAEAIGEVLGSVRSDRALLIGSVKANIGHMEPASGIAGLIKAALVLHRGAVPASINFSRPNPNISFDALNLRVPQKLLPLPGSAGGGLTLVNSFGFGGTNACALLAASPRFVARRKALDETFFPRGCLVLVPLSGPSEAHLMAWAKVLARFLRSDGRSVKLQITQVAAALAHGQDHFAHRAVVLARSVSDLANKLDHLADRRDWPVEKNQLSEIVTGRASSSGGKLVFTFTGQGGQFWNMGRNFLESSTTFRRFVEDFDELFLPLAGWSVVEALASEEALSRLSDPSVTPAAMFALQAGLAKLWKTVGIVPDLVVGHSFGEVTAAFVADGIALADVAHLVNHRGLIRGHIGRVGGMAAIGLGEARLRPFLPTDGSIEIGAYNSPNAVTVTGDQNSLDKLIAALKRQDPNVLARMLDLDFAWHSSWLGPAESIFKALVGEQTFMPPRIPVISTVTGRLEQRFDTDYWWRNLRYPVRFETAINRALDMGGVDFVELGPTRTLSSLTAGCASAKGSTIKTATTLQRGQNDFDAFSAALASLYVHGRPIDWRQLYPTHDRTVELPRYVWLPEHLWRMPQAARAILFPDMISPLLGQQDSGAARSWSSEIALSKFPSLDHHRILGRRVLPAAVMIAIISAAAQKVFGERPIEIIDLRLPEALFIEAGDHIALNTRYDSERGRIQIWSAVRGRTSEWTLRAEGRLAPLHAKAGSARLVRSLTEADNVDITSFYEKAAAIGYEFGPTFRGLCGLRHREERIEARVAITNSGDALDESPLDPRMLDSCFQVLIAALDTSPGSLPERRLFLPRFIGRVRLFSDCRRQGTVSAQAWFASDQTEGKVDLTIADASGSVCIEIDNLRARAISISGDARARGIEDPDFFAEQFVRIQSSSEAGHCQTFILIGAAGSAIFHRLRDRCAERACSLGLVDTCEGSDAFAEAILAAIRVSETAGKVTLIYAAPLDMLATARTAWPTVTELAEEVARLTAFGLALKAIEGKGTAISEVWILTRHGRSIDPNEIATHDDLVQGALIGAARSVALECDGFRFHLADVDDAECECFTTLLETMTVGTAEAEVFVRSGELFAPRLGRRDKSEILRSSIPVSDLRSDEGFVLRQEKAGAMDSLFWETTSFAPPQSGQAVVKVTAVGLNFRDIMAVSGLLPKDAERDDATEAIGLEFSGVIDCVGEGVTEFVPGDRVFGMVRGAMRRKMTISVQLLHRIPDNLSDQTAASIPAAYLTAYYALEHVGSIACGESVLIHSGAGGVGQAAIAIAKRRGAKIFATAGSSKKRDFLEAQGVDHVLDSRTLSFADEIMALTDGRGVDLVLNSLPGAYIEKGLDCLAAFGSFIELGKRDIYGDRSLGLKTLRRNISFHVVDLAAMLEGRPLVVRKMMAELVDLFKGEAIEPPPMTVFPANDVVSAFRFLADARHIGKVVIDLTPAEFAVHRSSALPLQYDPQGSYVVTGGSSGFGSAIGHMLIAGGAGRVILASRSGRIESDGFRESAKEVVAYKLDVSDPTQVVELVWSLTNSDFPLKGVIHAAVVYADAPLAEMSREKIDSSFAPKVAGALNLTKAIIESKSKIDFFVSLSSLAQVLGWRGQSNYTAANGFLVTLAAVQRSLGIPGSCLNLGMLSETGYVARRPAMTQYLQSAGWRPIPTEAALDAVRMAMTAMDSTLIYAAADWGRVLAGEPVLSAGPRFGGLLGTRDETKELVSLAMLNDATRPAIAEKRIRKEIAAVLRLPENRVAPDEHLSDLGLDSLSTFELWNRVEASLVLRIPMSRFSEAPTLRALSDLACSLAECEGG